MREQVVVAGMGTKLEAAVAPVGFLCGKTTVLVQNEGDVCSYALCAFLNSDICQSIYRGLFSMRGISGKAMNIGPRQIELLPIPPREYLRVSMKKTVSQYEKLSFWGRKLHSSLSDKHREKMKNDLNQFIASLVLNGSLDE